MTPGQPRATFIGRESSCSQQVPPREGNTGGSITLAHEGRRPSKFAPSTESGRQPRAKSYVLTLQISQPPRIQTRMAAESQGGRSSNVRDICSIATLSYIQNLPPHIQIMKKKAIAKLPLRGSTIWLQDDRFYKKQWYKKSAVLRGKFFHIHFRMYWSRLNQLAEKKGGEK